MLNTKKMIARVEKLKIEVASMLKEAEIEGTRIAKIRIKHAKAQSKIAAKIAAFSPEERTASPLSAKVQKLHDQLDAMQEVEMTIEDVNVGAKGDYPEDSIMGALDSAAVSLDELVKGKGRKLAGHLSNYETSLAAMTAK